MAGSQGITRSTSGNSGPGGNTGATKKYVDANIKVTPNDINEVGNPHTFTVEVNALVDATGLVPSGFAITPSVSPTPDTTNTNTCATPTVSANGLTATCTITINNSQPGVFEADASATVCFAGLTQSPATACVPPVAGSQGITRSTSGNSGPGGNTGATKKYVDGKITVTPNDINEVGNPHTFTVTATALVDATGLTPSSIAITPSVSPAPGSISDTCATPTISVDGLTATCTITINNNTPGVFEADASAVFTFTGLTPGGTFTRDTAGNSGPGGNTGATKKYVDAYVTVVPNDINEVGNSHTFTCTATALVGNTGLTPSSFTLGCTVSPTPDSQTNTCASPTISANGLSASCTLTISNNASGVFTANASASICFTGLTDPASGCLTRDTDPATAPTSGPGGSGPVTKKYVDGFATVTPDDINGIGESHTFTCSTTALVDATGLAPSSITLGCTVSPAPTSQSNTCSTPTISNGGKTATCTLTITNNTPGTFTANAAATLCFTGLTDPAGGCFSRDTNPATATIAGPGGSGPATKVYVDGSLKWFKVDDLGQPQGGATFQVCQTHSYNSDTGVFTAITPVCVSVTDNSAPDTDATAGTFQLLHLYLGRYTVHETAAPPGFIADPDTVTVDLTMVKTGPTTDDPTARNKTITLAFVNTLGSLAWEKRDGSVPAPHPLQGGATFQVTPNPFYCRTPSGSDPLVVADNGPNDSDPDNGQFSLLRVCLNPDGSARTYTITETIAPSGYLFDLDVTRTRTVSAAAPNQVVGSPLTAPPSTDDEGTRDASGQCTDNMCDFHNRKPPTEIAHTQATCQDFIGGLPPSLQFTEMTYGIRQGTITNTSPGVFFAFTQTIVGSGTGALTMSFAESTDAPGGFSVAGGDWVVAGGFVRMYQVVNGSCVQVTNNITCTGTTGASPSCTFDPAGNVTPGTYVYQVKYQASGSLVGKVPCPGVGGSAPQCNYTFTPTVNGVTQSSDSFLFRKR
ncbi:MAG: hypothetical protein E6J42_10390 [Chloroflexi bacterium]|nr:MAG: hypothetical protein E6J42_10390 [Chloroflexota bacterium]